MSPVKVVVLAVLIGIGFWVALVGAIQGNDCPSLVLNLGTELMGAGLIYLVFDLFIGGRERREAAEREVEAHKKELIARMGSDSRDVAVPAADELRRRGWLTDGSLQRAHLASANLQRANLWGANLQRANLWNANLQGASLWGANLQRANLWNANLQGASPWGANLQGANLTDANLQRALLEHANLQAADLEHANLEGAFLEFARFDETTTLPDDTKWTPDTDLARFTDPDHHAFWRSDKPYSPAHQPKEQE